MHRQQRRSLLEMKKNQKITHNYFLRMIKNPVVEKQRDFFLLFGAPGSFNRPLLLVKAMTNRLFHLSGKIRPPSFQLILAARTLLVLLFKQSLYRGLQVHSHLIDFIRKFGPFWICTIFVRPLVAIGAG